METKKHIRIGLLGFGSMGKTHSYAVKTLPFFFSPCDFRAEIVGICTTNVERTQDICDTYGIPLAAQSEDDLINDPSIDVIDICTPNCLHYETLKKALLAGKHIYCEKPLCVSSEQADEIAEIAASRPEQICNIVFNNRFLAPILRAKELVDNGKIGRLLSFSATYLHNSSLGEDQPVGWKQDREICGGGVLFDLGSHVIDLIYFLGGAFSSVYTQTQVAYTSRIFRDGTRKTANAEDAFYMIAELENGATGIISADKITAGANDDLSIELFGEKGALRFSLMDPNYLYFYDETARGGSLGGEKGYTAIECVGRYPSPGGSFPSPKAPSGWLRGHVESMYRFLDSISRGVQQAPDFSDAAYVQKIMDAAYRSAQLGIKVEIGGGL